MTEETGCRDVFVVKRIDDEKIREILAYVFDMEKDEIAVISHENNPMLLGAESAKLLCLTHTRRGDVSLWLALAGYRMSDDLALKRLIGGFMKFRTSCYIDKDNYDDFYHVDEAGNLVIATEVYDDDEGDVHKFVVKGPYDGSLGGESDEILWNRITLYSSFPFGLE